MYKLSQIVKLPRVSSVIFCTALSLLYAVCSQVIIPIPFNAVPLSLQPLPLFVAALIFGWPAVSAYALYLVHGALGAPIFAFGLGGISRLCGPTGGYLIGFLVAAAFLAWIRKDGTMTTVQLVSAVLIANIITFTCGLLQLSLFVPVEKLLLLGLIPFLIGDFGIKLVLVVIITKRLSVALQRKLR